MNIALIDADLLCSGDRNGSVNQNLMKLSGYLKAQGHSVHLSLAWQDVKCAKYDSVWVICERSSTTLPDGVWNVPNIQIAGDAFGDASEFPEKAKEAQPDLALYDDWKRGVKYEIPLKGFDPKYRVEWDKPFDDARFQEALKELKRKAKHRAPRYYHDGFKSICNKANVKYFFSKLIPEPIKKGSWGAALHLLASSTLTRTDIKVGDVEIATGAIATWDIDKRWWTIRRNTETEAEEAPVPPKQTVIISSSLPEPYYKDEFVTLYHGSSREIMPLLEPASFDLILTDPPFGIDHHDAAGHTILNDDNLDWLPDAVNYMAALLKYKGHLYCFSSYNFIDVFISEIKKHLSYRYLLIWDKGSAANSRGVRTAYAEQYEPIIMAVKGVMRHLKFSARPSSIIKCPRMTEKNRIHQHEKPVKLIADIVSMNVYNLEEPRVIDPFAGSGVVGDACKRLGVPCVLIELDERHCKAIKERLMKIKTRWNLPDIATLNAFREERDGKPPKREIISPKRKKELERMMLDAEEQAKRILEEAKTKRGLR